MIFSNSFYSIYEELSQITEAKADTQRLIDFAGADLAKRFLAVKSKFKVPENDLYYWIKNKTVAELADAVAAAENTRSKRMLNKDIADSGAKLIQSTEHWTVYEISSFAASQKYGRDTQWCITGVNDSGDKYWQQYSSQGVTFYFVITKDNYDARGVDSKYAIAVYPDGHCEIFNQQDEKVPYDDIPFVEEIQLPGIDLETADVGEAYFCDSCGCTIYGDEELSVGPRGEIWCLDCWQSHCGECDYCGGTFYQDELDLTEDDMLVCPSCLPKLADFE